MSALNCDLLNTLSVGLVRTHTHVACTCVRMCVRVSTRVCVRACVRACARACIIIYKIYHIV